MPPVAAGPAYVTPMKALLTAERPAGDGWVFERKLDGIRCLAVKDGGRTRLYSRNELSLDDRYPSIAAALTADPADGFVIDGEAVAFVDGHDRFGGGEGAQLFYYVFDVLFAEGRDVRSLPLEERRAVLERVLDWKDPLRITEQVTGDGAALLATACQDGWEGLIAKRLGRPYVSTRSRTTTRAAMSNRSPRKDGWRRRPSAVHSLNAIWTTSAGSTHVAARGMAFSGANGDVSRTSGASRAWRSCSVARVKPVPTLPA
jgi:ATP-dependent DNA ligase